MLLDSEALEAHAAGFAASLRSGALTEAVEESAQVSPMRTSEILREMPLE